MPNQKTVAKVLKDNCDFLKENYGVKRIGLFGSVVKGQLKKNSDIDILIEFSKPLGFKYIQLVEYLEALLGREVDILTPAGIKSIRVKRVADNIARSIVYV